MSTSDRCQLLAGVTGAIWRATDSAGFGYLTVALLWWAVIDLSVTIRADRRRQKAGDRL